MIPSIITNLTNNQIRNSLYKQHATDGHLLERAFVYLGDKGLSIIYGSAKSSQNPNNYYRLKILAIIEPNDHVTALSLFYAQNDGKWTEMEKGVFEQFYLKTMLGFDSGNPVLAINPAINLSELDDDIKTLLDIMDTYHGPYHLDYVKYMAGNSSDSLIRCTKCPAYLSFGEYVPYKRNPTLLSTTDGYTCKAHWCKCMLRGDTAKDYVVQCETCRKTYVCRGCKIQGGNDSRACCNYYY